MSIKIKLNAPVEGITTRKPAEARLTEAQNDTLVRVCREPAFFTLPLTVAARVIKAHDGDYDSLCDKLLAIVNNKEA